MALVFRGLGNPTRLGILRRMMAGRLCVGELQDELGCSQPNVSQHLAVLRDRGMVISERDGNRTCYRLADARIADLLRLAEAIFEPDHAP
ncbi:MAG: ArsR/SmtB family transcription factor [Armatimonadota bacterium]